MNTETTSPPYLPTGFSETSRGKTGNHFPLPVSSGIGVTDFQMTLLSDFPCDSKDHSIHRVFSTFPLWFGRREQKHPGSNRYERTIQLRDRQPFNISRSHCVIETVENSLQVRDCRSTLGTQVNGTRIGSRHGRMTAPLVEGENELRLGNPRSPYVFRMWVKPVAWIASHSRRSAIRVTGNAISSERSWSSGQRSGRR